MRPDKKGERAIQLYPSMLATFIAETWSNDFTSVVELVFLEIAFRHADIDRRKYEFESMGLSKRLTDELV